MAPPPGVHSGQEWSPVQRERWSICTLRSARLSLCPSCLCPIPTLCVASCQWASARKPTWDFQQRAGSRTRFSSPWLCFRFWRIPDGWPDLHAVTIPRVARGRKGLPGVEPSSSVGTWRHSQGCDTHLGHQLQTCPTAPASLWAGNSSPRAPPNCLVRPAKPTVGLMPPACLTNEWDKSAPPQGWGSSHPSCCPLPILSPHSLLCLKSLQLPPYKCPVSAWPQLGWGWVGGATCY